MTNPWITHVKKYASDHNMSYKDAMVKAKSSYMKQNGGGPYAAEAQAAAAIAGSVAELGKAGAEVGGKTIDFVADNKAANGAHRARIQKRIDAEYIRRKKLQKRGLYPTNMTDSALLADIKASIY